MVFEALCVSCVWLFCLSILKSPITLSKAWQPVNKGFFQKIEKKKWEYNTFAFIVYICVLVFIINQHNGWKVPIYEIQIKKINYPSTSFLKGCRTSVMALAQVVLQLPWCRFDLMKKKGYRLTLKFVLLCWDQVHAALCTTLTFKSVGRNFIKFLRIWNAISKPKINLRKCKNLSNFVYSIWKLHNPYSYPKILKK